MAYSAARGTHYKNVTLVEYNSSYKEEGTHEWQTQVIEIDGIKIGVKQYTPHDQAGKKIVNGESLDIFIYDPATRQQAIKNLEGLTGINIREEITLRD